MSKKISRDHIDHWYEYHVNLDSRTLYIGTGSTEEENEETGIDHRLAAKIIKGLHLLEHSAPLGDKPITILLNSIGGSVDAGLAIFDSIIQCKNHVTIKVIGNALSMGCVLLQAGDTRQVSKHSTIMFHEGVVGYPSDHPRIVKNWAKYTEKVTTDLRNILLNKIKEKHPNFKEKQFNEMYKFDTLFTAEEAVALGLVDEII